MSVRRFCLWFVVIVLAGTAAPPLVVRAWRLASSFFPGPANPTNTKEEVILKASYEYEEVDESDADVILVVEISIPALLEKDTHRRPMKRNPKATLPGVSPVSFSWRACGGRVGYGGTLSTHGGSGEGEAVTVSLSVDWRDRDGNRGEIDHKMQVPWLGEVKQELGNKAWARVHFEVPTSRRPEAKLGLAGE